MSLSKEQCNYMIMLLESRIEKLKSLSLGELTSLEKTSAIETPKKIIEILNHFQKKLSPLDIVKLRKKNEKTQKNTTRVYG